MSMNANRRGPVIGALLLVVAAYWAYAASINNGFFADDFNFLEPVARLNLPDYLVHYFDPRIQELWYRPLQGVQIWIEWQLFGPNATGYHLVNIGFHAINCVLLYALVRRVSGRGRLAWASALIYGTFPVYSLAINWINITDPLATIFFLLGIWFWWSYLERRRTRDAVLTLVVYALGLLCKQMVITLPVVLFLLDRLLFPRPNPRQGNALARVIAWLDLPEAIRHYSPFGVVMLAFAGLQYGTRSTHTFAGVFGYGLSLQTLSILVQYSSLSVFPWGYFIPNDTQITEGMPFSDERNLIWLAVAVVLYLGLLYRTRSRALLFLAGAWLVTILPVLPFPFVELRYLYLPAMTSGIVLGLWFDRAADWLGRPRLVGTVAAVAAVLLVAGSNMSIANANAGIAEIARQRRVPYRDITRLHPTFPDDTWLYFIDSISPISEMKGLFTLRYGPGVRVGGNDGKDPRPRLREHAHAYVYYFDETGKPLEVAVDRDSRPRFSPSLPLTFASGLVLQTVELSRTQVAAGDVLIAILEWQVTRPPYADHTESVRLKTGDGRTIAGYDGPPHQGLLPASVWRPHAVMIDPIVLPIPANAPAGDDYRLEISVAGEDLPAQPAGASGGENRTAGMLVVAPLSIIEKK